MSGWSGLGRSGKCVCKVGGDKKLSGSDEVWKGKQLVEPARFKQLFDDDDDGGDHFWAETGDRRTHVQIEPPPRAITVNDNNYHPWLASLGPMIL